MSLRVVANRMDPLHTCSNDKKPSQAPARGMKTSRSHTILDGTRFHRTMCRREVGGWRVGWYDRKAHAYLATHGFYCPAQGDLFCRIQIEVWGFFGGTERGELFADEKIPVDVEIVAEEHGEKVVDPRFDHDPAPHRRRLLRRLSDRRCL